MLIGASGSERNLARVAEWADGWIPMGLPSLDGEFVQTLARLRRLWDAAGRDPIDLDVTILQAAGPREDIARVLDRGTALGVRRVLVYIPEEQMDLAPAILDEVARGADLIGRPD